MAIRSKLAGGISATAFIVAGLTVNPAIAAAQDATTATTDQSQNQDANDVDTGQVIIVTGFAASLRSATVKKKNADVVVESVSAEDIGKLPDNGIGESIARLPGVSAQRSAGRANIISIRGFGPDFSTTTLNGREQTTTNDSRAVEFDQYPSEILSGVDVYKTAEADRTAGGLVGSIDLRTIRPLDANKKILAIGARGTYVDQKLQPGTSDTGYRVYGTYVDQFADDTLGVALSAAYTDEPYQTRDWNAWGYDQYGPNQYGMSGIKTWFESDKLKRLGVNGTIQYKPSDTIEVTLDGFYSHFVDRIDQRGFEMPILYGAGGSTVTAYTAGPIPGYTAELVDSATVTGKPVIENYANDRVADQYSFAGNLKWDNDSGTRAMIDLSWSRTDRHDDRLETTAGLGRNLANPTGTLTYQMTDHGPEFTSTYDGASSALVLTDVEGWSGSPVQAGYDKIRKSKDDLKELRAELEHDIDFAFVKSVKIGVDHTYRQKSLTQDEAFLSPPNGADTAAIPSNLILAPVTLDRGLGQILAYDPRVLVAQGVLDYLPNPYGASQAYDVTEDVWTPYVMAKIDSDLGNGNSVTGNFGVQAIHTSTSSAGAVNPTVKDNYWMILPSMNVAFRSADDLVLRFAVSKEMMRPRLNQMNNIVGFGVDQTRNPPIYVGGGGNPLLRPYQAWAFDMNVEKYFGNKGYLAVQAFYKTLTTYIDPSGFDFAYDYSPYPTPPGIVPTSPIGQFSGPVNTKGGYLMGLEVAGTLPFELITPALSGFGLTGGAGYTETKATDYLGNRTAIPGYSKWVGSLTAYYEKGGFNLRGSMRYRSGFLGDFALFSGGLDRQYVLPETVYDAQIGYDFPDSSTLHGLSLYIQGQNLTDQRSATLAQVGGEQVPGAWLKYQTYGRRVVAGFTYKF
ncbi:TonB-dependent receptor [Tsuneonella mangrovi]|uniref:TonB-dependent receptor n=1 Tax=Tsuneonella mangrovi TaxID=1982042 RepID=UPI00147121D1|nr:TonB-dependent receptor [Tsuneonella mangrovi]